MSPASGLPITVEAAPSGARPNFISVLLALGLAGVGVLSLLGANSIVGLCVGAALGIFAGMAPQVAKQWERAVVLRLGHYQGLRGPGLFWRIPFVDHISAG